MKKFILTFLFVFTSLFIIGCNGKEETYLKFEEEEISVTVGDNLIWSFYTNIEDLSEVNIKIANDNYIELSDGKYTAIKAGEVTVKATWSKDSKVTDSVLVIINDLDREIIFEEESISIHSDATYKLELDFVNLDYSNLGYRFTNSGVVTLDSEWNIIPKTIGSTVLTIFYLDNEDVSLDIPIIITQRKEFKFTKDVIEMDGSKTEELPLNLIGYTISDFGFLLSADNIIRINGTTVTAVNDGSVIVKAFLKSDPSVYEEMEFIVEFPEPELTIFDYEYWVNTMDSKYDPYEILYTKEEIQAYNAVVWSDYSKTKVVDILNQPTSGTKQEVTNEIQSYNNMNSYNVYNDETQQRITNEEKQIILDRRNLNAVADNVNFEFGLITDFARMRSYPTNYYSQGEALDRFQETSLNVGEGVVIKHTSSDGKWYFVQAYNYKGWVEAKNIAKTTYQVVKDFLTAEDFIVVTGDKIDILGAPVRMGQTIPFTSKTESAYVLSFPTRNTEGNLELVDYSLSTEEDFNEGYLDYTFASVLELGFKLIGITYSWGDKYLDGRDCSSTMNNIYAVFGFKLPRNTSNQNKVPGYSLDTTGQNRLTLQQLKDDYRPGSLIFSSGHVMMYIGENEAGESYMLHTTTGSGGTSPLPGCKLQSVASYGINSMIATLKLYD